MSVTSGLSGDEIPTPDNLRKFDLHEFDSNH